MLAFRPHRLTQPTETYSPQFFPGEENPLRKRHYLGISLGTGISPGFQNNRTDKADATFSPVVGLRYAYAVTPAIRLQTGILYQGRGGLHADSTYRSTDFSFGAETMATTISPQTLHYLEIPLVADIRLRGRHSLLAGANLSLLLNARSEVRRQLILPFETQDMETTKEWGYTQGFRPMDMSLTAGYRYYLGRGTRVGFQGNYGLRDITEQGFFRNAVMDRNLQFRFILEYDLAHF
ncbi:MAG: outer membrane beta-barrel protein [Bacteroidia bacterium]